MLVPIELSTVALTLTLIAADSILQHGNLNQRNLADRGGVPEQRKATSLQRWISYRVLQNEPGRLGCVLAHQRLARPPVSFQDHGQPSRIAFMKFAHPGMISLEKCTAARELLSNAQIFGCHRQQLDADGLRIIFHARVPAPFQATLA